MATTIALFAAGIALGIAAAFVWAWGVKSGQFRNLEQTKEQLFWPDIAPADQGAKRDPEQKK
ncbi:MAG: hypothetical protein HYU52_02810 [Acidobacteria bacterium]|nr:hypothetical protein [Acidobacteriota bacterium]